MSGKNRPVKYVPVKKANSKSAKVEFAGGDNCVYCGKSVKDSDNTVVVEARVHTRSFPVCSAACQNAVESYVEKDKKHKMYMYLIILAAAACILIGAVSANMQKLMYVGLSIAGLAFVFLPYPISTFETFQRCPIRTATLICRIIGVFLVGFGIILSTFA